MRITKGKVVDGRIIVEGETLTEGAAVTVLRVDEASFELGADDEAALLRAIAEADRGELLDANQVLSQFPRPW
jgi:predicted RNase H-like HicB family nuclease